MSDKSRLVKRNYSLTHLLDPAWTVNDLVIEINGARLKTEYVLTYEILWDGPSAKGIISFTDYDNFKDINIFAKQKGDTFGALRSVYTSQKGSKSLPEAEFDRTWNITGAKTFDGKDTIVELHIEDLLSTKLDQTFLNKTYSGEPGDVISSLLGDINSGFDIVVATGKDLTELPELITSAATSIKNVAGGLFSELGFNLIQDKNGTYCVHDEHLTDDKAIHTNEIFYFQPKDVSRRDQVIEFKIDGYNYGNIKQSAAAKTTDISKNIGQGEMDTSVNLKVSSSSYQVVQQGERTSSETNISSLYKALNEAQTCNIWVPGWNGNRMGMKVGVELPKTASVSQNENSETFTGDWIVTQTRDKIINSYFVQELFLRRA